ncbi:zinc-ribbon domain-containing protein [Methanobacterium sp. CWC-01]|uniref:zinc ribbon domain-containing protein n=1 Tax=Methanobacterium aridiramus TaxID=2584467 RepID=UPI0025760EFB|nr:zinc ribbon domain-containing protein [Methanobacterium sp. CWC-01]WJI09191.1 zinc-ribbon domain-containing protein [Methanobacterium sp. CWC-01]
MGTFIKKLETKCPECGTQLTDPETKYCPECGAPYLPEPQLSRGTAIWIILALIFVFPIGVIGALVAYYDLNKKKEAWRQERLINAVERG